MLQKQSTCRWRCADQPSHLAHCFSRLGSPGRLPTTSTVTCYAAPPLKEVGMGWMRRTFSCGRGCLPESSTQQKATRTAASPTPRKSISFWTSFTGATVTVWRRDLPPLELDEPGRFVYLHIRTPLEALGTSPLEGSAMAQLCWAIAFLRYLWSASGLGQKRLIAVA